MVKPIALVAVAAAVWLVSVAQADDQPPGQNAADPAAMFAQLDTNQDGQLTTDEVPAEKKRLFERLLRLSDKNGDGKLSRDEFTAGIQRKPERPQAVKAPDGADGRPSPDKMFKRLDANGDGKVTLDEVPEPRKPMFEGLLKRADKDGDGALTEQEFTQGIEALRGGKPPEKPGNEKRPPGGPKPEQIFRRLDKNGDGKLTLDEVPEERRPMFERIFRRADKDGDKALTLEEFTAGFPRGPQPPPGQRPESLGARAAPRGGLFQALDTDHDGKLSSAEISAAPEVLKKLDKNGDGTITLDELISAAAEKEAN